MNQRELLMKEGTAKHAQTAHASDRHLPKALEKLATNPLVCWIQLIVTYTLSYQTKLVIYFCTVLY